MVGPKAKPQSRASRAGLAFPVGRIATRIRKFRGTKNVAETVAVAVAAASEYMAADIIEMAGNSAKENGRQRIIPRDIFLAIANEIQTSRYYKRLAIPGGGVLPRINHALLSKATQKRLAEENSKEKSKEKSTTKE